MHASRMSSEAARRELLAPLREAAGAIEADLAAAPVSARLVALHEANSAR
jgi:hypothetical protein